MDGSPNWLALSVADTGIGMTSSQMSRVFESFSQGDGSIGRKFGGTGLGLSICRELVKLLGGKITVDSLEGRGSTFSIFLPTEPAEQEIVANYTWQKISEEAEIVNIHLDHGVAEYATDLLETG